MEAAKYCSILKIHKISHNSKILTQTIIQKQVHLSTIKISRIFSVDYFEAIYLDGKMLNNIQTSIKEIADSLQGIPTTVFDVLGISILLILNIIIGGLC